MTAYILILLAFAIFIGFAMESYKKLIRRDKAAIWEIRLVALILSGLLGAVTWRITNVTELSPYLTGTPWMIIPYTILIYILQKPACMKFWKPILKKWLEKQV